MFHILGVVQVVTLGGVALVVVVAALVQAAKATGLPARWAPAVATIIGLAVGAAAWLTGTTDVATGLVSGFLAAMAAVGIYSGTKNTFRG